MREGGEGPAHRFGQFLGERAASGRYGTDGDLRLSVSEEDAEQRGQLPIVQHVGGRPDDLRRVPAVLGDASGERAQLTEQVVRPHPSRSREHGQQLGVDARQER